MKLNFKSIYKNFPDNELIELAEMIANFDESEKGIIWDKDEYSIRGFKSHTMIDVCGSEFAWMNKTFHSEKFTWYHYSETMFLVPDEMLSVLKLRWS